MLKYIRNGMRQNILKLPLVLCAAAILFPLILVVTGSLMGEAELKFNLSAVFEDNGNAVFWPLFPMFPTLRPYVELLLDSPEFFKMFWNSCFQTLMVLIGQLIVGVSAAWSFGRFNFKGRKLIFIIYILLMIMPFQVTMVSSYLVLDKLGLIDTHLSIILPGIFSTFPVFIMTKFFEEIPKSYYEAAKIDGAGEIRIFMSIGIPLGSSGIISAFVLQFLEYWNILEQPITFLKTKSLWPMSLYLPNISASNSKSALAASVIMLFPAILVFYLGQDYLEQGISAIGVKE